MYRLSQCELVYINQSRDSRGNPVITPLLKMVKCKIMESFSQNYYQSQTREMRNTKNILISKPYTEDISIDGATYHLEYVNFNSHKYKVINILVNRGSAITSILDCDEVINE